MPLKLLISRRRQIAAIARAHHTIILLSVVTTADARTTRSFTPASAIMPADYLWTCACGGFTAELAGEPVFDFNCHCRAMRDATRAAAPRAR